MNGETMNVYEEYVVQKGYTVAETRKAAPKEVPAWYAERYPGATYESYQEALHDYLNGI